MTRGSINKQDGVYHITIDDSGTIVHRTFIPENDWARYSRRWNLPPLNQIGL